MIRVDTERVHRISQGDILRDVEYFESVHEDEGILEIRKIVFPLALVLTQDCDLQQDYNLRIQGNSKQDRMLVSALLAPMYNAEHVFAGEHLLDLGIEAEPINKNKTPGEFLKLNTRPRYHYLAFDEGDIRLVPSVIDFKHYFSAPITYLESHKKRKNMFVCKVDELYREDISQRFAAFLSRVALPDV